MIFCVEDDSGIRDLMVYALNAAGLEAAGFDSGASLEDALRERRPSLILLDIMLPGQDGLSILKKLRARTDTADIPIIMATAKGTEFDRVTGLDLGADDYLSKPFGMMEMVSRVRAVLRRAGPKAPPQALRTGGLELDLEGCAACGRGALGAYAKGVPAAAHLDGAARAGVHPGPAPGGGVGHGPHGGDQDGGRAHRHPAHQAGRIREAD